MVATELKTNTSQPTDLRGWQLLKTALSQRKTAVMLGLGFGSGLPYTLLLSSLTFLVGSLGRAALGEAIERSGYASVFYFTAALGIIIAIVFCLLEWARSKHQPNPPGSLASH